MRWGIHSKLFFSILMTSILVVIGMMMFTHWSIQSGFVAFVEDRQAEKIAQISEELVEYYEESDSWEWLANNRRLWRAILFGHAGRRMARYADDDEYRNRGHRPPRRQTMEDRSSAWPPDRILRQIERSERHLPFETRLMLFDRQKNPVFGRAEQLPNSQLFPLVEDGHTIGYLALIHGPSLTETGQVRFLEKQKTGLVYIALGVILLSAVISVLLSRRLVKPVQSFRQAARALASGDYASRVDIKRRDELGALARDINALGESLQANEVARKQWVADIAHELRTPLSVLRGELEALQAGIRPLDSAAIDSLHEDALRLGRLIDDLYQLSVTDLGSLGYKKQRMQINRVLQQEVERHDKSFAQSVIKLSVDLENSRDMEMPGDPQRLSQLFANLLSNSLRYTDEGGELRISTRVVADNVLIDFQDSSPGVPQEALEHLFERLYRAEGSRSRHSGGAGLGLAIAHNIVSAHGGEIQARHSPLGGLWIEIRFPAEPGP